MPPGEWAERARYGDQNREGPHARSLPGNRRILHAMPFGVTREGPSRLVYRDDRQVLHAGTPTATDLSLSSPMTDGLNDADDRNLTAMTMWSWSRFYGAPIDDVVEPAAMPTIDALARRLPPVLRASRQ
jgi:hypothetical protein